MLADLVLRCPAFDFFQWAVAFAPGLPFDRHGSGGCSKASELYEETRKRHLMTP